MTAAKSSSYRWACGLATLLGVAALLGVLPALSAGGARPPTADEVRELQAKFQAERDALVKSGADKRFLPQLLTNAEGIGHRASTALTGGRLLQAAEGFRQARWQLPYNPPEIPDHTARVFGNLRLRHAGEINSVAFSPDGQLLATAGRDRTVRVWDLANGHEAIRYRGHDDNVRAVVFSPDGKLLASGGGKDVRLWK